MNLKESETEFYNSLVSLDRIKARSIIRQGSAQSLKLSEIEKIISNTLYKLGWEWEEGTASISQVFMAGKVCEELVDEIIPAESPYRKKQPKAAITVFEDFHALGKRIVYSVIRSNGFELSDWGFGMKAEDILKRLDKENIEVLLISVLMLNSALHVKDLIKKIKSRDKDIKIIVGGAPFMFDDYLYREVGADATGNSASDAVKVFKKILAEKA